MKTLYTMRHEDGQLMAYDGSSWDEVGTFVPTDWPNVPNYTDERAKRRIYGCFVWRGKLFTRWQSCNDTGGAETHKSSARIAVFDGSDLTEVADVENESAGYEFWGPVTNFKGRIYWLATPTTRSDSTGATYFYLYTFYHNGSNYILDRRRVDEVGEFSDGYASNDGAYEGPNAFSARLTDYHDRLLVSGPGATRGDHDGYYLSNPWSFFAALDIGKPSGVVSMNWIYPTDSPTSRTVTIHRKHDEWLHSEWDNHYITSCAWKDKIYALSYLGNVYAIDPTDGTRTLAFDISEDDAFKIPGSTFTSTDDGDGTYTIKWALAADANDSPWQKQAYGTKVKITNYNGGGDKVGYITQWEEDDDSNFTLFDEDGVILDPQDTGATFDMWWGLIAGGEADYKMSQRFAWMFVHDDKLYCMIGASRNTEDTSAKYDEGKYAPPWALVCWTGTGDPDVTAYTNSSDTFTAHSHQIAINTADEEIHILTVNDIAENIEHRKISLVSPYTMTAIGSVCAFLRHDVNYYGQLVVDGSAFLDEGDVTITIEDVNPDAGDGKVVVSYKLWSTTSASADVSVEYNTAPNDDVSNNDWRTCTRRGSEGNGISGLSSSGAGSSHSFVHDVENDMGPSYTGNLQYRIRVI